MCVCSDVHFCVRVYLLLLVLLRIEESRPNTNDEQAHQQAAVRDESTIPAHGRSHVTVCLQKLYHSLRSIVCLHLYGSTRSLTAFGEYVVNLVLARKSAKVSSIHCLHIHRESSILKTPFAILKFCPRSGSGWWPHSVRCYPPGPGCPLLHLPTASV